MNLKALGALVIGGGAVLFYFLGSNPSPAPVNGTASPVAPPPQLTFKTGAATRHGEDIPELVLDLQQALSEKLLEARFTGNGRDKLSAVFINPGVSSCQVKVSKGQLLTAGNNRVMVVQSKVVMVLPGRNPQVPLTTFAIQSSNTLKETPYFLSSLKEPKFDALLNHVERHPELSVAAIQTMALVVAENLPLSAVAKFTPAIETVRSRFDTDAFRVEPVDIIAALSALREMGMEDSQIALTIDPQLKIEAMIEPLSRVPAMRYYGLTEETEWEYWKTELLGGAPATRHYALYGIARFYPDIALQMLPTWAREVKTNAVYRLSAVQALADTQRPEAGPILRQLVQDLGPETELGRAALGAAECLDQRLKVIAERQSPVLFRVSNPPPSL